MYLTRYQAEAYDNSEGWHSLSNDPSDSMENASKIIGLHRSPGDSIEDFRIVVFWKEF